MEMRIEQRLEFQQSQTLTLSQRQLLNEILSLSLDEILRAFEDSDKGTKTEMDSSSNEFSGNLGVQASAMLNNISNI